MRSTGAVLGGKSPTQLPRELSEKGCFENCCCSYDHADASPQYSRRLPIFLFVTIHLQHSLHFLSVTHALFPRSLARAVLAPLTTQHLDRILALKIPQHAEAIVVRMPSESPAERRAEGTTAKRPGSLWIGNKQNTPERQQQVGEPRHSARTRTAPMVQPSQAARREAYRTTCGT
jgi:hypothetical protein